MCVNNTIQTIPNIMNLQGSTKFLQYTQITEIHIFQKISFFVYCLKYNQICVYIRRILIILVTLIVIYPVFHVYEILCI